MSERVMPLALLSLKAIFVANTGIEQEPVGRVFGLNNDARFSKFAIFGLL